jgi:hypothetical protein
MNTEPNKNESSPNPLAKKPTHEEALCNLEQLIGGCGSKIMEMAFIAALQGEAVREIGRYQVYSDFRETRTVVFIHEPTGWDQHKYVFAVTGGHTYNG